jgi:hypothetical protein
MPTQPGGSCSPALPRTPRCLLGELERLHPHNNTFPGEVFLRLAADALAWSGVSPADPLPLDGTRERFLPDYYGRGRDRRKLQFAILATAALHGGAEPDLYALLAAVRYIRAAAHRVGVPVRQACQELAPRSGRQPG